jgi:hypothetical protein
MDRPSFRPRPFIRIDEHVINPDNITRIEVFAAGSGESTIRFVNETTLNLSKEQTDRFLKGIVVSEPE